jgi:hypothetical protein
MLQRSMPQFRDNCCSGGIDAADFPQFRDNLQGLLIGRDVYKSQQKPACLA